jgi:hypothetical protein
VKSKDERDYQSHYAGQAGYKGNDLVFDDPHQNRSDASTVHFPPSRIGLQRAVMRATGNDRDDINLAKRGLMKSDEISCFERFGFLRPSQKISRLNVIASAWTSQSRHAATRFRSKREQMSLTFHRAFRKWGLIWRLSG